MKKWLCIFLSLLLIFLSACVPAGPNTPESTEGTISGDPEIPTDNVIVFDNPLVAVSVPTVKESTVHEDGAVLFEYTYQHISLVLDKPAAADKIILDFLNRVDATRQQAKSTENMAASVYSGSQNWIPYQHQVIYSPTRIDNRVLSLFGTQVTYSGAIHPDRTCASASYDLKTGDVLTLASIMHKDASLVSFCELVLDSLKQMSEGDYLYENYERTVQQRFSVDPTNDEDWYFTQNGLCFYFAPYEIAPYASGVITVEIPYEKLDGLLYEPYLPEPKVDVQGTVSIVPFDQVEMSVFEQIGELVTDNNGEMYMICTDGPIRDVRILSSDNTDTYIIFASYSLTPGDGIMVQGDIDSLKNMVLTYKSASETLSIPLITE